MITFERDTITNPELPSLKGTFNNGDLGAIDEAVAKWKFKDETSMMKFILAVLLSTNDNKLFADAPDGKRITLSPASSLLADSVTRVEATKDGGE